MIAVIDYGMGNLRSVQKALEETGAKARVTSDPADLKRCRKLVLPGVGAFGDAMKELRRRGLVDPIKDAVSCGKPFLGLCLGLQLLFEKSEESPGSKGLSLLSGEVKRFRFPKNGPKVPHMGWNSIAKKAGGPGADILKSIPSGSYVYFVHSYFVLPKDKKIAITVTDYGVDFISGVRNGNIYGFQFHPEKSQALGLKILKNFAGLP